MILKTILIASFIDFILIPAFWLCGPQLRIPLFIGLGLLNLLFYFLLLFLTLRAFKKRVEPAKGFALDFVMIHLFPVVGLFLFKVADLMIEKGSI